MPDEEREGRLSIRGSALWGVPGNGLNQGSRCLQFVQSGLGVSTIVVEQDEGRGIAFHSVLGQIANQ